MNKKLLPLLFGGLSLFYRGVNAQDMFGVDYVRKIEVNRTKPLSEDVRKSSKNEFYFSYNNFSEPYEGEAKNSLENKIMNIYFKSNDTILTDRDYTDIGRLFKKVIKPYLESGNEITSFNVVGYADCMPPRGVSDKNIASEYNYNLSYSRAKNVANEVDRLSYSILGMLNPKIFISAYGDLGSKETRDSTQQKNDRVVKIIVNGNPVENALTLCESKTILVDQSGSMTECWDYIKNLEFPVDADVLFYSQYMPLKGTKKDEFKEFNSYWGSHTYKIDSEFAWGRTCFYEANEVLLPTLNDNSELNVIINGKNDFKGSNPSKIINLANDKNIKVNIIGFDLTGECISNMIKIASETGGRYYIVN